MPALGLGLGLIVVAGCAPPPISEGGFDSAQPAAKLYAIRRAGEARDAAAVPKLIEQLDSDDPAVRMFAIEALRRITGQRLGYDPYALPYERHRKVADWVRWYESHRPPAPADKPVAADGRPG
jgi:hypothetical protein